MSVRGGHGCPEEAGNLAELESAFEDTAVETVLGSESHGRTFRKRCETALPDDLSSDKASGDRRGASSDFRRPERCVHRPMWRNPETSRRRVRCDRRGRAGAWCSPPDFPNVAAELPGVSSNPHVGAGIVDTGPSGRGRRSSTERGVDHEGSQGSGADAAVVEDRGGGSRVSGAGPTCYGIFPNPEIAQAAAQRISAARPNWWVRAVTLGN